jgi:hypothetical protein
MHVPCLYGSNEQGGWVTRTGTKKPGAPKGPLEPAAGRRDPGANRVWQRPEQLSRFAWRRSVGAPRPSPAELERATRDVRVRPSEPPVRWSRVEPSDHRPAPPEGQEVFRVLTES